MTGFQDDRIKKILAAELDRLIDEYRELEAAGVTHEQIYGNHVVELEIADYDFVIAITYEKGCSLAVATAALIEWHLLYPQYEVVISVRKKN